MFTFFICVMLVMITWLLWLNYQTLDGFNEDLKQLRMLVGHIERKLSGEPILPIDTASPRNSDDQEGFSQG